MFKIQQAFPSIIANFQIGEVLEVVEEQILFLRPLLTQTCPPPPRQITVQRETILYLTHR